MAIFRDASAAPHLHPVPNSVEDTKPASAVHDRPIGDIIRRKKNLSPDQVDQVLQFQREKGVRFGEAAVALGLASDDDVMFALSQQFHYPYAPDQRRELGSELITATQPFSYQAEAFRAIRSQLMMRLFNDEPRRALAIVSPDSGDGKTFFAANLAVVLSQLGGRTLLVDADLRGPRQHEVFELDTSSGLSGILSGRAETNVIKHVPNLPSLFVLPVGITPPNPLELVERPAFGLLIRELLNKFDHVIVDTPAAVFGSDATVIAAKCGAALVVARQGKSKVNRLQDLVATLSGSPAKLAGVIMNEH
ncbi:polysaccharide biosynthesis tyrosine autokinase [Aquabacterium sp. A7-Y]|uniref:polysaccharide biosynthesis tyrosine autokinase n=1 Tax=Aquabacterium sp. A7-Y TaxID=1349605 RepID=UPI00223D977A|nr:polysaccharide biosynthesis tyrosine autokinase [Aquabacterium sp. A7-Y]MCW7537310.1 polysaccharide biosynthesis tyrosine autokinase [Aquabacterium sp. A7-Y]